MNCLQRTIRNGVLNSEERLTWCEGCCVIHDALFGTYADGIAGTTTIGDARKMYPCTKESSDDGNDQCQSPQ